MPGDQASVDYDNVPGNYYDKYATRNPIARAMVQGFLSAFRDLSEATGAHRAWEIGCGEGRLTLDLLERGWSVDAFDVERSMVDLARSGVWGGGFEARVEERSIYDFEGRGAESPVVVCCEVLEHLPDPERALRIITGLADPWVLLSVPREPLWRTLNVARGRYLRRLGNTPGHIQHWSKGAFVRFAERHMEIVTVRSPLPWTMVLGRAR